MYITYTWSTCNCKVKTCKAYHKTYIYILVMASLIVKRVPDPRYNHFFKKKKSQYPRKKNRSNNTIYVGRAEDSDHHLGTADFFSKADGAGIAFILPSDRKSPTKHKVVMGISVYDKIEFPGGRSDREDISIEQTAIRETIEELGISKLHIPALKSYLRKHKHVIHLFNADPRKKIKHSFALYLVKINDFDISLATSCAKQRILAFQKLSPSKKKEKRHLVEMKGYTLITVPTTSYCIRKLQFRPRDKEFLQSQQFIEKVMNFYKTKNLPVFPKGNKRIEFTCDV